MLKVFLRMFMAKNCELLASSHIENWLAARCAPSAVPLVDDVVETSEMARQNGKELSYP